MVQRHKVTQFYTAPTAIRALMSFGPDIISKYDLSSLRVLGSVGEPINPEAWRWYNEHVSLSHDKWRGGGVGTCAYSFSIGSCGYLFMPCLEIESLQRRSTPPLRWECGQPHMYVHAQRSIPPGRR